MSPWNAEMLGESRKTVRHLARAGMSWELNFSQRCDADHIRLRVKALTTTSD